MAPRGCHLAPGAVCAPALLPPRSLPPSHTPTPTHPHHLRCAVPAGDSFSGSSLDCRMEAGQVENQTGDMPPRVLGAVCHVNGVAALLTISRRVFRRAVQMHQV